MCLAKFNSSQRVYSNKTRIKTLYSFQLSLYTYILKEYIPIKQGLRHEFTGANIRNRDCSKSIFQ